MKEISLQSSHLSMPRATYAAISDAARDFYLSGIAPSLQDYPNTWGDDVLRQRIDAMTPTWPGEVLVTGSATQGLNLTLGMIANTGRKTLAVNIPAYFGVLRTARDMGFEVKTFETVDDLAALGTFDSVLLSSNFTPPRGISFSAEDKGRIAALSRANDAYIIEDNAYDPIWQDAFPAPIHYDADKIIRVCTLSKIAAPGLRLGFIKADPSVMQSLRSAKITLDLSSSVIPQLMARDALREDVLDDFRTEIAARVRLLRDRLIEKTGIAIPLPEGGPFVCLDLPQGVSVEAMQSACEALNLKIDANAHYFPDNINRPFIRLNASGATLEEIELAASRLGLALKLATPRSDLTATFKGADALPYSGQTFVVSGGRTINHVDSVRHIMNEARPEGHGHEVAAELASQGARVILVSAKSRLPIPRGVTLVTETPDGAPIITPDDMTAALQAVTDAVQPDVVLALASVPSLRMAEVSSYKLKLKNGTDSIALPVADTASPLAITLPEGATLIGYDGEQELVAAARPDLVDLIVATQGQAAPQEWLIPRAWDGAELAGRSVIVTSGRTHETLNDDGDVITNFASGRQGHQIALALAQMGARVTLVTGPASVAVDHPMVETVNVRTAAELQAACLAALPADAAVCVSAVGDFKAAGPVSADGLLPLAQNPDTLKTLGLHDTARPAVVIGFAAETHDLLHYAQGKLTSKGADAICANLVGDAAKSRGANRNAIQFVTREGIESWDETGKGEVGFMVGRAIADRLPPRDMGAKAVPSL